MQVESWGDHRADEYRMKCMKCGCIFKFKHSELSPPPSWSRLYLGTVRCPQCDDKTYLDAYDLRRLKISRLERFFNYFKIGIMTSINSILGKE